MRKAVGVIIPSYNQGKYIRKTIESVIENSKNIEMDIAIIDGGSSDGTISIIKEYANDITYWCSEADGGQADAINKGISKLPNCKYYLWLNSDDVYEDADAVKKLVEYAESNNYQVCYGLSHFIDEFGNIIGEYPTEDFNYQKLGKRCYLSQPSVMFSKMAYDNVGPINDRLKMCLDYEYWIRLAQKYKFGYLNEYIGATRIYESTKTSTLQAQHLQEAFNILNEYYGKVPMRWVVTKYLCGTHKKILHYLPKRILMIFLLPIRNKIIKECLRNQEGGNV